MKRPNRTTVLKRFVLICVLLAPFFIYFDTARSFVAIWNSSETFAHGYSIVPISLWLIWRKRQVLQNTPMQPWWPGLALLVLAGLAWMLSQLGDVQVIRQYSFVALIGMITLTLAGRQVAQAIAFPLFFLLLAVPFGDIFVAPLVSFTADFTVMALQLTGIPVVRVGPAFTIPTGSWSVVDACSGVRYLISSFTLGCLFAYLTYSSFKKRILLIIAALIVPVLANGMRAYMIVMIGHLSSMKLAVGVDHLIYGWIFFGLIMYLLFSVGNIWRDDPSEAYQSARPDGQIDRDPVTGPPQTALPMLGCAVAIVLCLATFPLAVHEIDHANFNARIANLDALQSNWPQTESFPNWRPVYLPAQTELERTYAVNNYPVRLFIKFYRNQSHQSELISSSNKMNPDYHDKSWTNNTQSNRIEKNNLAVHETQLSGTNQNLVIWSMDWINGAFNNNHVAEKIIQTWNKITLQGGDAAAVIISAPFSENPEEARAALRTFLNTNLNTIETVLNANRGH